MQEQIENLVKEMTSFQADDDECNEFHALAVKIAGIALRSFRDDLLQRGLDIARAVADFGSELAGG